MITQGWIRPTDTSINVASTQNKSATIPSGIRVEVLDEKGGWNTVIPNGGFPQGN
ncbi:MAG: hypothetical protein H8E86_01810 [Planctomycetes bacterium]|nr:hypothetical protein [Planctomycetota bacterium]